MLCNKIMQNTFNIYSFNKINCKTYETNSYSNRISYINFGINGTE